MNVARRVVLFALLTLLVTASASLAADPAVFHACVNRGNGSLRLVDAAAACHATETRVQWNAGGSNSPAAAYVTAPEHLFTWISTGAEWSMAELNLPAGKFLLNGKVVVVGNAGGQCVLRFIDAGQFDWLDYALTYAPAASTIPLQAAITITTPRTVQLVCMAFGLGITAEGVKLSATSVGSITVQ